MIRILLISFSFLPSTFAAEYTCKGDVPYFSSDKTIEEWLIGSGSESNFSEDIDFKLSIGEGFTVLLKEETCDARHLQVKVLASSFRETDSFGVQEEFLIEEEGECLIRSEKRRRLTYYSPRLKQVTRFVVSNESGVLRDCRLKRMR